MQIYIQDLGWRGSIVAIADNEEEAREIMKIEDNYEADKPLEVKNIEKGLVWIDYGDT